MHVQGCVVVCGTKRQHSGNMVSSCDYQKQARIETDAEDMELDESGTLCFTCTLQWLHFAVATSECLLKTQILCHVLCSTV